jgi:hypothetical protein
MGSWQVALLQETGVVRKQVIDAVTAARYGRPHWLTRLFSAWRDRSPSAILPSRLDPVEIQILSVLSGVYGRFILSDPSLLRVLDVVAKEGAVKMVQRSLWGGGVDDLRLRDSITNALSLLECLVSVFPERFVSDAQREISRIRGSIQGDAALQK